ncbi:helix-turn-helix transcriptional regulator [Microvirga massiliensis]|uniref:helix-turn-helix transcriptional regulator n=1 Tax=Microvirga massiliensis TaxID=1033741 RepID=UPI00062BABCB|nr:LuxR C-terminal-related transcriptional regulator [Microvirga massiliensis]
MIDFLDEPPSRKLLKQHFLDAQRREYHSDILNCAAHMILVIDDPDDVMEVALQFLVCKVSACRADCGFLRPDDKLYAPNSVFYSPRSDPPRCDNAVYPNRKIVFQHAWKQRAPVACDDVATVPILRDSRDVFSAIQSRSILFQRLSYQRQPVGLVCMDYTHDTHSWRSDELRLVHDFCDAFFGPIAWISHHWHQSRRETLARKPSQSELEAIRLAAAGLSYKSIAESLGKSVKTVENQLRNARLTLGAANQAELISKCQLWL